VVPSRSDCKICFEAGFFIELLFLYMEQVAIFFQVKFQEKQRSIFFISGPKNNRFLIESL